MIRSALCRLCFIRNIRPGQELRGKVKSSVAYMPHCCWVRSILSSIFRLYEPEATLNLSLQIPRGFPRMPRMDDRIATSPMGQKVVRILRLNTEA